MQFTRRQVRGRPATRRFAPRRSRPLFKIHEGDVYSLKKLRKGFEKLKELYGAFGYCQWTPDPELKPRGIDPATGKPIGPDPPPPIMDITSR